jgi:hypothetical protein
MQKKLKEMGIPEPIIPEILDDMGNARQEPQIPAPLAETPEDMILPPSLDGSGATTTEGLLEAPFVDRKVETKPTLPQERFDVPQADRFSIDDITWNDVPEEEKGMFGRLGEHLGDRWNKFKTGELYDDPMFMWGMNMMTSDKPFLEAIGESSLKTGQTLRDMRFKQADDTRADEQLGINRSNAEVQKQNADTARRRLLSQTTREERKNLVNIKADEIERLQAIVEGYSATSEEKATAQARIDQLQAEINELGQLPYIGGQGTVENQLASNIKLTDDIDYGNLTEEQLNEIMNFKGE